MKNDSLIILILLFGIIIYTSQNNILRAYWVGNGYCQPELNRYNFYIFAYLEGHLSKSMFENYTINVNSDYDLEVKCDFPEINNSLSEYDYSIKIPCYIDNIENGELSFSFEGKSNELELIDFNENILYFYDIYCRKNIKLILGEIKDQECKQYNSDSEYHFKITLLNETLPKNLNLEYIYLKPNFFGENDDYYYNIRCSLVNEDYNNYFKCSYYSNLLNITMYFRKNYTYEIWRSDITYFIKNLNEDLYIGKNIVCYYEHKVNYLDIFKGECKNGAFLFSIDFNQYIKHEDENTDINYKILLELKAKVDSKTFKNYCYLDNGNKDGEFDISKYKLNCAIPSFDKNFNDEFKFYDFFSEFFLINFLAKIAVGNDLFCYGPKKYITAFYYYYDICSNINSFKIISFTTFNDSNIFNSTLNNQIEIPIISPFKSTAICQITSLILEPFIEFNCTINNNTINITNYKNITFGNVTTEAYYDSIYPIVFDSFDGEKEFGSYCSSQNSKCSQLIESDYGLNSANINNPKIYQYSFCLISEKNYIFNNDYFQLKFKEQTFGNCSIKNEEILKNNSTKAQLKCSGNKETLDKYPLLKNIFPFEFNFYINIFNDINILTKSIIDITEIDLDFKITINKVKKYYCMNKNNILIMLSADIPKPKNIVEAYIQAINDELDLFLDYSFKLDNSVNITFIDYDLVYGWAYSLELLGLISTGLDNENIIIKNDIKYKTFFNNFSIIWENKNLLGNIKCNNNEEKIYIDSSYLGKSDLNINGFSLYDFSFYDNDGNKLNKLPLFMVKNGIINENVVNCKFSYRNYYLFKFSFHCNIYYDNITFGDIVSFGVSNITIKANNGIVLKIEGLEGITYKYNYYKDYIAIYKNYRKGYCTEDGYFFELNYYKNNYINDLTQYNIKNLINPINNELIEGECQFENDNNNYNYYNYYYNLTCKINSPLINISYINLNNTFLDKINNSFSNIYIYSEYDKPRIEFEYSFSCDKSNIFTINEIKEKNCLDGTYAFKIIGTLSRIYDNIFNEIFIRDIIENGIQIYCNNLSYYETINNINFFSFNCYIVNDTSNDNLIITFLDTPPYSNIISINYSSYFNENKTIIFDYKCNSIYKFKDFYYEFNSTLNLFFPIFNKYIFDVDFNMYSFKILIEMNKIPNNTIYKYYNKLLGNYLIMPIDDPSGVAFCYLKDKNISRATISECYGITDYYLDLEEEEFDMNIFNSLNLYSDIYNIPNLTFLGFIDKFLYNSDINYPNFRINNISKGCINDKYNFNISGEISEIDENIDLNNSIPKVIKLNLENDLYSRCDIYNIERNIKLICYIVSNNRLNNEDIKFNVSKLEIDEKNIIIDGIVDFLKTAQEILLDLDVNCGTMSPEDDDNIDTSSLHTDKLINDSNKDHIYNLSSTIIKDYNISSTTIKEYQQNLSSSIIDVYNENLTSTIIGEDSINISSSINLTTTVIENNPINLSTSIISDNQYNLNSTIIKENPLNLTSTIIKESPTILSSTITKENSTLLSSTIIKESSTILTSTVFEQTIIAETIIDTTPKFYYDSVENGNCSNGIYYFYINGNMTKNSTASINDIKIDIINIRTINGMYNATCHSEEIKSKNNKYNYKFRCSFTPPSQYISSFRIYKPSQISNFKIEKWPNDGEIIIKKEIICTNNKFTLINYNSLEVCDMYSDSFSFEIEMESNVKEGILQNKTIKLNIIEPSSINEAICYIKNIILNTNIKLNCHIYNLTQEKRIINGININGIIKHNISDEYLITNNNEYIKLIDFKGRQFTNIECPKDFEIKHCKDVNKIEKKCKKCYKNYYLNDSECLTCSQLNEGCSSCNGNGKCSKCLNGFELQDNNCIKKEECDKGRYGSQCKKCEELYSNCDDCNNSGYCIKCKKGYYLTGIDDNSKCVKCLSTCKECESLNKCTICKDNLILNNGSCVTCLSFNEGCEKCSEDGKCTKCYNNKNFKYEISDDKCIKKEEENKNQTSQTNLIFGRFDGYEKEDDKIHFKPHFILLDNYLYNTTLHITIIVIIVNIQENNLRSLEETKSIEKDVICNQYGDALGSDGGYLANFKCTMDLEEDQELLSMEPTKMEIKDKDNKTIQNFETEKRALNVSELEATPLDEEYEKYKFNRISIINISDTELNDNLSFNIKGNIDSEISKIQEYEILLKDNNNKSINSTCYFPIINNVDDTQTISCISSINSKSKQLTFEEGIYASRENSDDKLILNNNDDITVEVPKKNSKISKWIIIAIAVAGFIIICIVVFLIVKFKNKNNNNNNLLQEEVNNQNKKIKNVDNSKDIIIYQV